MMLIRANNHPRIAAYILSWSKREREIAIVIAVAAAGSKVSIVLMMLLIVVINMVVKQTMK